MFSDNEDKSVRDYGLVQKTNVILKIIGLNANTYISSIEHLLRTAPVLIVSIYEALYNHYLENVNHQASNARDHEFNVDMVIIALRNRYQDKLPAYLTGQKVINGDKNAIEAVLDIYYEDAERLIKVYNKNISPNHPVSSFADVDDSAMPKNIPERHKNLKKSTGPSKPISSNAGLASDITMREYYETNRKNFIPGELKMLMERVTYLETKLERERPKSAPIKPEADKKKKKKRKSKKEIIEETLQGTRIYDDLEDSDNLVVIHDPNVTITDAPENEGNAESNIDVESRGSRLKRLSRPKSAPQTRRPVQGGRYLAPSREQEPEEVEKPKPAPKKITKKSDSMDESKLYTYDPISGRRILAAQLERINYQHKAEVENMKRWEDLENDKKKKALNGPPTRTIPSWPGHRTEKSVDEYLERMKRIREVKVEDPGLVYSKPRTYNSYQHLSPFDIVISVEHCTNCAYHSISLRHDENEYIHHADTILRNAVQTVFECHPCARVGVIRFPANIPAKSVNGHTRIGALEVQIAFKNQGGYSFIELLHSKLLTRRWPSKAVIEKRLKAFLINSGVPTHAAPSEGDSWTEFGNDGLYPYPIGIGEWKEVMLSDPNWKYVIPDGRNDDNNNANVNPTVDAEVVFPFVHWAFDSKKQSPVGKFPAGTSVKVSNHLNEWGYIEKYPLVGVVEAALSGSIDTYRVKLQYFNTVIAVHEDNLTLKETSSAAELDLNKVPNPLKVVITSAIDFGLNNWTLSPEQDKRNSDGDILLSPTSFFTQVYKLVWNVLKTNPRDFEGQEPQLAYADSTLQWVFAKWKSYVNMSELEKLCKPRKQSPRPNKLNYSSGDLVLVKSYVNEWGFTEKYPLVGSIQTVGNASYSVKLNYLDEVVEIAEDNLSKYTPTQNDVDVKKVPTALKALIIYAVDKDLNKWTVLNKVNDKIGGQSGTDVYLCRSSFFIQIHRLVYQELQGNSAKDLEALDVQSAFSESTLNWVFTKWTHAVNMSELEKFCRPASSSKFNSPVTSPRGSAKASSPTKEKVMNAISTVAHHNETFVVDDDNVASVVDHLRKSIADACLQISPPVAGSKESTSFGDTVEFSKYRKGADKLFTTLNNHNKSRTLDKNQFRQTLRSFGINCEDDHLSQLWSSLDLNGDARISVQELVSFLHFTSFAQNGKELCDVWQAIRDALNLSDDDVDTSADSLMQLEGDMYTYRDVELAALHSHLISSSNFMNILKKYSVSQRLQPADIYYLALTFGVKTASTSNSDTNSLATLSPEEAQVFTQGKYFIKYNDFISWLYPLDADKVLKRVARFLSAVIGNESSIGNDSLKSIEDVAKLMAGKDNWITKAQFQNTIDELGLPLNSLDIRTLFSHINPDQEDKISSSQFIQAFSNINYAQSAWIPAAEQEKGDDENEEGYEEEDAPPPAGSGVEHDLYADDFEDHGHEADQQQYDDHILQISTVDLIGEVLENLSPKLEVEVSYGEDRYQASVNSSHKQGKGKRSVIVEWLGLEISKESIKSNENLVVILRLPDQKELGRSFIPIKTVMTFDKLIIITIPFTVSLDGGSNVTCNLYAKLAPKDALSPEKRIANMSAHDLARIKFDPLDSFEDIENSTDLLKKEIQDIEDDDASKLFPMLTEDEYTTSNEYVNKKDEKVTIDSFEPAKVYQVRILRVQCKSLRNVELMGSNDPYVKFTFGSWTFKSSVQLDSGEKAEWDYSDDADIFVSFNARGSELQLNTLKVEVFDENKLKSHELIGSGSCIVQAKAEKVVVNLTDSKKKTEAGKVYIDFVFSEESSTKLQ